MFVSMHHQVMDLQDEAVQPYEGGKGTIEEVHQDRTRRKNIIKLKKTSNTKRRERPGKTGPPTSLYHRPQGRCSCQERKSELPQ